MITNGSVKYSLPAAYAENRPGAEVTLHFAVPDGVEVTYAEGMLVYVGDLARVQALRMQNGGEAVTPIPADHPAITGEPAKPRATRTRKATEVPAADPLSQAGSAPSTVAPETAAAPPSSQPSVATGPVLDAVGKPVDPLAGAAIPNASVAPTTTAPAGGTDPLAAGSATASATPVAQTQAGAATPGTSDPLANGTATAVPAAVTAQPPATVELSNADLSKAIMGAMQTLSPVYGNDVAAQRVGETIRSYASEAAQIPVDKRPEFVEKLRVLA